MKSARIWILAFLIGLLWPHTDRGEQAYSIAKMGYAQDRCCNTGCLARVTPGRGQLVARIIRSDQAAHLFFAADSSELDAASREIIKGFALTEPGDVTIVGYTDACGSINYNRLLSAQRASAVKGEFRRWNQKSAIQQYAAGEISDDHDPLARRVDLTTTQNTRLYSPPPRLEADVYLLDSSGSMAGTVWKRYIRSIEYHRPPGSRVYISTTRCIGNGTVITNVTPSGYTEIWFSYYSIIDKMKPGQTLAIISDFQSRYPLSHSERNTISKKAQARGIRVMSIRI